MSFKKWMQLFTCHEGNKSDASDFKPANGVWGKPFICMVVRASLHLWWNDLSCLILIVPCVCVTDEGQTVCGSPADMQGRRLAEVGLQLRTLCHQTLGTWDYLFFVVIGFVIFAAGTVSAWLMGVVMVLYERYIKKKDEQLDMENEDDSNEMSHSSRGRKDRSNRSLKTLYTV